MRASGCRSTALLPHVLLALTRGALGAVLACSDASGDAGITMPAPGPTGGYSVSLSTNTLSVERGDAGTLNVTVARSGSFGGTVQVTGEKLPDGVTLTQGTISAGNTTTTLTVGVRVSVAVGAYAFTVRARAAEAADQTMEVGLTVTGR